MTITIFTPTYNRAHLLPRTFQSIQKQNNREDCEWLIVDDGSDDNTEALVASWISDDTIDLPIRYIKKENGGKHSAINRGVSEAKGDFFAILDSDDQLAENAIQLLKERLVTLLPEAGGIIGLAKYGNGKVVGTSFLKADCYSDFATIYYQQQVKGDKSVLFRTKWLKEFPFPEPNDVKFVSELTVWHPLSNKYPVLCINEFIEEKEYQDGGLSNSSYKKWYLKSIAYTNYYLISKNIHSWRKYPKIRWGEYVQLILNSKLVEQSFFAKLPMQDKLVYLVAYPRAYYSYLRMKPYVEKNNQ